MIVSNSWQPPRSDAASIIWYWEVIDGGAKSRCRYDLTPARSQHAACSQHSASVHSLTLHLRYENQEDTPKGPLMLDHPIYHRLMLIAGMSTNWCSDTQYAWFGRPKKKKTIFFSYVFFFYKWEKVMYCVEKSLWIQIWFALRTGASGSLWMNAGPQAHVVFFCMYLIGKWRGECEFVILKPVLGHSFSVCKFTQQIRRCSIIFQHLPLFCSLYIIEGNPLFITPLFFPFVNWEDKIWSIVYIL